MENKGNRKSLLDSGYKIQILRLFTEIKILIFIISKKENAKIA